MSDETTPPKEVLDKEVRLRCTVEQKAFMDAAAKDAGYRTLSDFVRPLLFDRNILVVDTGAGDGGVEFTVIPAFTADEAGRSEAKLAIDGMLELARQLAETPVAAAEPFPTVDPAEPAPGQNFTQEWPNPVEMPHPEPIVQGAYEIVEPPVPPQPAAPDPFTAVLQQVPPLQGAPVAGPAPLAEETAPMFIARRVEEYKLAGQSSLSAQIQAEAEWRAAMPPSAADPAPAQTFAQAPPVIPTDGRPYEPPPVQRGFCSRCGNPLQGTPFCAGCGTPV